MENRFSGIGKITSIPEEFYFSVLGFEISFTPRNSDGVLALTDWVNDLNKTETVDWFVGTSNEGESIYIELCGEVSYSLRMPGEFGSATVSYRLMIRDEKFDAHEDLKFDEINFYGEDIDLINPPGRAIKTDEGGITFINPKEYKKEWCIKVNTEEFILIKDIAIQKTITYYDVPDLKKNITSQIKFKFNERKSFSDIYKYYEYMTVFLSFLTGRSVSSFEVELISNIEEIEGELSQRNLAVCINKGSLKIEVKKLQYHNVIQIDDIDNNIPNLFAVLNDNKNSPYLFFLPETNDDKKFIKYTQIIDLSASMEWEYLKQEPERNEELILQSKELVEALVKFIGCFAVHPKVKEKALKVIRQMLTSYQPSFKEKIEYLYYKYKDDLEYVTQYGYRELEFLEENVFLKQIKSFVSMRNSGAHRKFEWKNGTDIFPHLMILVYFSVFERSGMDKIRVRECIKRGFF